MSLAELERWLIQNTEKQRREEALRTASEIVRCRSMLARLSGQKYYRKLQKDYEIRLQAAYDFLKNELNLELE